MSATRIMGFMLLQSVMFGAASASQPDPESFIATATAKAATTTNRSVGSPVDEDRPTAVPSKTPDETLKRFVQECVRITPGKDPFPRVFVFGTSSEEEFAVPPREVAMSADFRINKFEVTQELYQVVMESNPSRWKGPRNSAESMTFSDALTFCQKLTALLHQSQLIAANEVVRLPTEAEWEYCCRAGSTTRYSFGETAVTADDAPKKASLLDPYAWHTGNAEGNDPAVGVLKPNAWGLYDMHGYLSEFVADRWSRKEAQSPLPGADPPKNDSKSTNAEGRQGMRILRGGSWRDDFTRLTSTARLPVLATAVSDAVGFRCVIAVKPQPAG